MSWSNLFEWIWKPTSTFVETPYLSFKASLTNSQLSGSYRSYNQVRELLELENWCQIQIWKWDQGVIDDLPRFLLTARVLLILEITASAQWVEILSGGKFHSYIASENLLIRFGKGNLPCLQCKVKALAMPSFWPEGIDNAFILSKNQCECLSFWPEGIANAFLFTLDGKFSLTIGMIMPLGWGEVTGIIPKLVTQGPFWFPTRKRRKNLLRRA